jgi:uncharacterized damage-inducible protein DinB
MTGPLVRHFRTLAAYNRLANLRLYEACSRLGEAELKAQRSSFFGSIHGTLNHVMVGDRIWLARFAGEEAPSTNLDAILYEDFAALWEARREEDARIEAFVQGIERLLGGEIGYVNNEGRVCADPVDLLVTHLFNHQTHHRGQIHSMLSQTDVPPPVLDLHRIIRPSSQVRDTPRERGCKVGRTGQRGAEP